MRTALSITFLCAVCAIASADQPLGQGQLSGLSAASHLRLLFALAAALARLPGDHAGNAFPQRAGYGLPATPDC